MLVLSRKLSQQILIGSDIAITVVKIEGNQVRLGIEAPPGRFDPSRRVGRPSEARTKLGRRPGRSPGRPCLVTGPVVVGRDASSDRHRLTAVGRFLASLVIAAAGKRPPRRFTRRRTLPGSGRSSGSRYSPRSSGIRRSKPRCTGRSCHHRGKPAPPWSFRSSFASL